jgi:hypothetical protein
MAASGDFSKLAPRRSLALAEVSREHAMRSRR